MPENTGACIYLKSLGLFQFLQDQGVDVDDRGIVIRDALKLVLPLTRFDTEFDVDQITNRAEDALSGSRLGPANVYPLVTITFGELALNAVQHAESSVGAYGFIQFYESRAGSRFVCGVADGGHRNSTVA